MLKFKHFIYKFTFTFIVIASCSLLLHTSVYADELDTDRTFWEKFDNLISSSFEGTSGAIDKRWNNLKEAWSQNKIEAIGDIIKSLDNPIKVNMALTSFVGDSISGTVSDYGVGQALVDVGVNPNTAETVQEGAELVGELGDTLGELADAVSEGFTGDENNDYPVMMLNTIYKSSYDIARSLTTSSVYRIFVGSSGYGLTGYSGAVALHNTIAIIGTFLVIAIAMGNYFKNIQQGKEPIDCAFQILVEIGIVGIFMINLPTVMQVLYYLGREILTAVSTFNERAHTLAPDKAEEILELMTGAKTGHFFWNVQAIIELILPFLFSYILRVILIIQFVSICFEIFLRKFFVPLAVADIYHEGFRSPGARYLKKYFGSYLKLACFYLILMALHKVLSSGIDTYFSGATLTALFTNMGMYIAINAAAIMALAKVSEIINDVIGV